MVDETTTSTDTDKRPGSKEQTEKKRRAAEMRELSNSLRAVAEKQSEQKTKLATKEQKVEINIKDALAGINEAVKESTTRIAKDMTEERKIEFAASFEDSGLGDKMDELAGVAETAASGDAAERKKAIKTMNAMIDGIQDLSLSEDLSILRDDMVSAALETRDAIKAETSLSRRASEKSLDILGSNIEFLAGALTGIVSKSPLMAFLTTSAIAATKSALAARKENRAGQAEQLAELESGNKEQAAKLDEMLKQEEEDEKKAKDNPEVVAEAIQTESELAEPEGGDEALIPPIDVNVISETPDVTTGDVDVTTPESEVNVINESPEAIESITEAKPDNVEVLLTEIVEAHNITNDLLRNAESASDITGMAAEEKRREARRATSDMLSGDDVEGEKESKLSGIWDVIKDKAMLLAPAIIAGLAMLPGLIVSGLKFAIKKFPFVAFAMSVFDGIKSGFDEYQQSGSIGKAIVTGLSEMGKTILKIFSFGMFNDQIDTMFDDIGGMIGTTIADFVEMFNFKDMMSGFYTHLTNAFDFIFGAPIRLLNDMTTTLFKNLFGEDKYNELSEAFSNIADQIKNWFIDLIPDWVPDAVLPESVIARRDLSKTVDDFEFDEETFGKRKDDPEAEMKRLSLERDAAERALADPEFRAQAFPEEVSDATLERIVVNRSNSITNFDDPRPGVVKTDLPSIADVTVSQEGRANKIQAINQDNVDTIRSEAKAETKDEKPLNVATQTTINNSSKTTNILPRPSRNLDPSLAAVNPSMA